MNRRRRISRIAFCTAAFAGLWAAVLVFRGGIDVSLVGIRLRSFDPLRPLVLAFVSTLAFLLSADEEDDTAARRIFQFARFIAARPAGLVLVAALAAATIAVGLRFGSPVAGGSDSYGYVSQADLWLHGRLTIEQPWVDQVPWPDAEQTLSPLGYHPGTSRTTLVPSYSAGLPMLMALAKLIGGHCALFSIVPLCGGLMLLTTFGLGRRLAGTPAGIAAAWLLATSPPFLFMLVTPMSDLPAAAFWTLAWWAVSKNRTGAAIAGGLAAAMAILIRPNLAPLALIPIVYLALADMKSGRLNVWQPAAFTAALIPAVAMTASLNQLWYGSPFRSGYGTMGEIFSTANFLENLKHYAVCARTSEPA